jgi:hypothetical protein
MSSRFDFDVAVAVGFGAGIFWFFKGFRVYREYRVLADTPEIPIRSIAMGLVEIHGKGRPAAETLVNGPVSGTPCLFYKVDIERWVKDKKGGHWSHYKTDANGLPFYLEDGTGKALVNAHGAEYDLVQSSRRETGSLGSGLISLFGGGKSTLPAGSTVIADQDLLAYVGSVGSGTGTSVSAALGGLLTSGSISLGGTSTGRYRLTEYCILPDHWYDVTGTCVENPSPKDEHDRNLIRKGENEPTFLISWRSEKEIERTLRRRALLHIFGGAALSVACLGILLARLGWL